MQFLHFLYRPPTVRVRLCSPVTNKTALDKLTNFGPFLDGFDKISIFSMHKVAWVLEIN